ncbi:CBS domain-containing protein [Sporolactobacillus putidus]|uniref:Inosine-5-monophosphate dehydrogenase n=1 Tax=Sporolactobacillus putidus TaxID=492735 RepID=A0A917VZ30_9BACL|nr:CBS domain-containing protein [Sporolactobacillus putidus]GGL41459.1 inosine-5-monophosphate dehydrogenase [Sporolactobacillus putidus]
MNVAFFITPKSECKYVYDYWTMRQAMEKMEHHRYTAVPILNKKGNYVGTLTEGDLLWKLKNSGDLDFRHAESIMLKDVPLYTEVKTISVDDEIENMIDTSLSQNFVPVVDDFGIFIGIIKRRDIIAYLSRLMKNMSKQDTGAKV